MAYSNSTLIENPDVNGYFRFRFENDPNNICYTIPQSVTDGSDIIQFSSNWSEINLSGSTEPMVAFNYVNAPVVNINLKFQEDMWREVGETKLDASYEQVISAFASMIYPDEQGSVIKPPYCIVNFGNNISYRGYFNNIRINQYGTMRNGHKTTCEISSTLHIIKKIAPRRKNITNGFRVYFREGK